MDLTIFNFFIYISLTWGTNILLNLLYVLKRYRPVYVSSDRAIDRGVSLYGNRLIGESTTLFGLYITLAVSILLYAATESLGFSSIPLLVYSGHMIGSFIKRRLHFKDGQFMPILDHGDYMIMTGLVLGLSGWISWQLAFSGLVFTYVFHPLACYVAYRLRLREYPY